MKGIFLPEPVFFARSRLDLDWQTIEMSPEMTVRPRRHGISRRRPALMSSSTSRRIRSNLPAATSRLICSSHSSSFQPWSQAASSALSSNESCSIAVLSSARLTAGVYRERGDNAISPESRALGYGVAGGVFVTAQPKPIKPPPKTRLATTAPAKPRVP